MPIAVAVASGHESNRQNLGRWAPFHSIWGGLRLWRRCGWPLALLHGNCLEGTRNHLRGICTDALN